MGAKFIFIYVHLIFPFQHRSCDYDTKEFWQKSEAWSANPNTGMASVEGVWRKYVELNEEAKEKMKKMERECGGTVEKMWR